MHFRSVQSLSASRITKKQTRLRAPLKTTVIALASAGACGAITQTTHATSWVRDSQLSNDVAQELGAALPSRRIIIDDVVPPIDTIRTFNWAIGGAGETVTGGNISVAPTAAQTAAVTSAINSIAAVSNSLIFSLQPAASAKYNNGVLATSGTTVDVFFAPLGAGVLGQAEYGATRRISTTVNPGPYGDDTQITQKIDLVLSDQLAVWDPTRVVNTYNPVVHPYVNPYGIYTGGQAGGIDDVEGTVIHEMLHALGLQHTDRAVQNYNTAARFTRNYDTAYNVGTGHVTASLTYNINEDNFMTSGLLRTEEGPAVSPANLTGTVRPNYAASSVMNSTASSEFSIVREMTPDDMKGLAYQYDDIIAQNKANALQAQTAVKYANPSVKIESDYSTVQAGADTGKSNNDPTQATRNDTIPNAQDIGILPFDGSFTKVVGAISGITGGLDTDYYKFFATPGNLLSFDLDEGDHVGNSVNTFLRLYDSAGNPLTNMVSDDTILNATTKEGSLSALDPAFTYLIPGDGGELETFYIRVGSEGDSGIGEAEGDYLLNVAIPEPGSISMILVGSALGLMRRRRGK